jgi:4-hydroxy-3-methylbut-2-enyl diphosphate reductase IspH
VRDAYDDDLPILLYGKHGHAEVIGLTGQTQGEAMVVEQFDELEHLNLPKKLALFSQTTKRTKNLYALKDKLESQGIEVDFNDTLCRQVSNRDIQLRDFAKQYDAIVFVAGNPRMAKFYSMYAATTIPIPFLSALRKKLMRLGSLPISRLVFAGLPQHLNG